MKKITPLLLLGLLTTGLTSLYAQQGFDVKKRKNVPVNTSSLHATPINGASSASSGRRNVSSGRIQTFPGINFQQDKGKVFYSTETGLPAFITTPPKNDGARISVKPDVPTATRDYLAELKSLLKLETPERDFTIRNFKRGADNKTHVRLNQSYKGVPIYGGEVVVHLNEFGQGESFNGNYYKIKEDLSATPGLSNESAISRVTSHLGRMRAIHQFNDLEKSLVQFDKPQATLVVYREKGLVETDVLAYHIVYCPSVLERWEYFVDANTGAVLHQFESTCTADGPRTATGNDLNGISRSINTYLIGSTYYLVDASRPMFKSTGSTLPDDPIGGIMTIDINNTFGDNQKFQHVISGDNTWNTANRAKGLTAHFNAGVAYDFFRTNYLRNSIDGAGGTILSVINMPDPEDGTALDNAFWNGKAMFYGNGDVGFKPLAGGLDVAGHEMTHGVVQSTANLVYQGESGAINESMADIFGSMMDPGDWTIGEDVVKTAVFPSGALRSLSDPHNGGSTLGSPGYQPRHMNEKYNGTEDNGGVHINSGIPNFAFYKFATATTRKKAADTFYKALDDYLTKSSKFIDLRLAVIKAAGDLYGANSPEVTQAGLAFDAVGITNGQGGDYIEELPEHPGEEYFFFYVDKDTNPNTLYRTSLTKGGTTPLSQTVSLNKPSVTDKGDVAVFVADDNRIKAITVDPSKPRVENYLTDEAVFANVVVSKGGTKLAAVTQEQQPKIFVYDFETNEWGEFELYNPTYSEGVNTAGPVYADALEFDYTGEYLVYDCFNRLESATGPDIEYWDVNFIRVWDNTAKTFGDGTIQKLFSSLPDGVSIGNPSFSKRSPNILAFDYMDDNELEGSDQKYAILGVNIETNEVNIIHQNTSLGWPSYNMSDTKMAFIRWNEGAINHESHVIDLAPDKISAAGEFNNAPFTGFSKWPMFFATGKRDIEDETEDDVITDVLDEVDQKLAISCYPNPFTSDISVLTKEPLLPGSRVVVSNLVGQRVFEYAVPSTGSEDVPINLESLKAGQYIMNISYARKTGTCKIVKK